MSKPPIDPSKLDPRVRLILLHSAEMLREMASKIDEILGMPTSVITARFVGPDELAVKKIAPPKIESEAKRKPIICRKCGYVGGNARGCGTPTGHMPATT